MNIFSRKINKSQAIAKLFSNQIVKVEFIKGFAPSNHQMNCVANKSNRMIVELIRDNMIQAIHVLTENGCVFYAITK
jgi:hypothetical protein